MKAFSIRRMMMIGWCATAALSIGCSSNKQVSESTSAVESMQNVHDKLGEAKTTVTRVMTGMDKLQAGGDMQKNFTEYSEAVSDLKEAGDAAAARGEDMKARRQEYLDRWQQEISAVQNAEVQQTLMARRQRIADEFDKVKGLAADVRNAYGPFLQDSQDIQKALAVDLTPAAVTSLKSVFAIAKTEGETLNLKIDALSTEVDSLIGKMTPGMTTAPAPAK